MREREILMNDMDYCEKKKVAELYTMEFQMIEGISCIFIKRHSTHPHSKLGITRTGMSKKKKKARVLIFSRASRMSFLLNQFNLGVLKQNKKKVKNNERV